MTESITRPSIKVDANTPSTLPMTVGIVIEKIVELYVGKVGRQTIRGKSSIVDLGPGIRSDVRLLNGSN